MLVARVVCGHDEVGEAYHAYARECLAFGWEVKAHKFKVSRHQL